MKILSLFDGMACGMLAMLGAGVEVERYVAYEIDKYAIQTSSHNFPMIEHKGDVFNANFTEYKDFDFIVGGSPCTYWSIAQKNNRETEASGMGWELFSQYVRAVKEVQPKYFIYENNKSMSKAIKDSISNTFDFEPVLINSALVSAQNRQRLYWVGKRNSDGIYSKVNVEQPKDRGILLKDILEFVKNQGDMCAEPINITDEGKSQVLKSNYYKMGNANFFNGDKGMNYAASGVAEQVGALPRPNGEPSTSQGFRIYSIDAKSVTLKGNGGGAGGKTGLYAVPCSRLMYAIPTQFDDKGNPIKAISCADGKEYTVYKVENGQITIKGKQYPIKLVDGMYIIRKLTVRECMRLQTIPEWYEFPVSNSQAYKQIGNGWTVDIIVHLINSCLNEE